MQKELTTNDKARNGLSHIAGVLGSITMIQKDGGRESGLTAKDQAVMTACCKMIAEGLDEGAAATSRVTELETELQAKGDEIAKLQAELQQLKAHAEEDSTHKWTPEMIRSVQESMASAQEIIDKTIAEATELGVELLETQKPE